MSYHCEHRKTPTTREFMHRVKVYKLIEIMRRQDRCRASRNEHATRKEDTTLGEFSAMLGVGDFSSPMMMSIDRF
jgi:hypothetical protein